MRIRRRCRSPFVGVAEQTEAGDIGAGDDAIAQRRARLCGAG